MKQAWLRIAARIDALSLRERVIVFVTITIILLALVKTFLLDDQFAKESLLSQQIAHDQSEIAGMQTEIQQKVHFAAEDPDVADTARLVQLKQQDRQLHVSLLDMQKGLIVPEKMNDLLQDMLKQNGKLQLVSLRTLPTSGLNEPDLADARPSTGNATASKILENADKAASIPAGKSDSEKTAVKLEGANVVYRHGVEIVIQGDYADMVNYMSALEAMPWQLFWGQAKLKADDASKLTLTLRLFTLSLDKKWLNI